MQNLNVIKHEGNFSGFAGGERNRWKSLSGIDALGAGCASGALQSNSSRGCSLNLFLYAKWLSDAGYRGVCALKC